MTRADHILILLAVCAMPLLYIHLWFGEEPAGLAQIRNGNTVPVLETLQPDRMLHISGPLGESTIEVNNGRIRFASSPCRTQVCVHSGWLTNAGEFTACLPNRISLTLIGKDPRFDSIGY